jgi:hypothetical protein
VAAQPDPPETDAALFDRVAALIGELERTRFAGGNPVVDIPTNASTVDVAARVLAAERANALVRLEGRVVNPQEDRAEADFARALGSLRYWRFGRARALLESAGSRATDPALQQRLGLWKLLADLVQRIVSADPDGDLRGDPGRPALDYLAHADRIEPGESDHYRREVARLLAEHEQARQQQDSPARALWYLLRARLALGSDEPVLAIAWCVRAGRSTGERLAPDEYLAGLLDQGRRYVLLVMGELNEADAEATREELRRFQAWDLYHALAARLGRVHGFDAHRETVRFSIEPYQGLAPYSGAPGSPVGAGAEGLGIGDEGPDD